MTGIIRIIRSWTGKKWRLCTVRSEIESNLFEWVVDEVLSLKDLKALL